ncbi:MerR family transcriptional regulator [Clostridium sp.]|uniref:MerR family transcriptional regulator n=1 Tax=Clostridium sp. TaxID=1506 RepID=UPI0026261D31|nr:MerR family transcriptional regulator [Clostridium sp.]
MDKDYIDADFIELFNNTEDKQYFTIDEVAEILKVDDSDIAFWFDKFKDILKIPNVGMFQVFEKQDVENLKKIKELIIDKNMSIKDTREFLSENTTTLIIREKTQDELNVFNFFSKIMSIQNEKLQNVLDINTKILEDNQKMIKLIVHSFTELNLKQDLQIEIEKQNKDEIRKELEAKVEPITEKLNMLNTKIDKNQEDIKDYINNKNKEEIVVINEYKRVQSESLNRIEEGIKNKEENKKHKGLFGWFSK